MFTMEAIKQTAIPIAKKFDIKSLSLFGSYARHEETEDSDLDFLIDKGGLRSLLQYSDLVLQLEDAFGCHVDVVTTGIDDKAFLEHILKESVKLYERE